MANTHEFQTIKKKYTAIVDHLAANVDPARFAQKLCEKDLLSGDIVARASVLGVMTTNERIRPVITAVKSRIRLDACKYHTFVDVLQEALPALAAMLTKFFATSLELHIVDSVADVTDWVELGHQLDVDPVKLTELQQCGRSSESCREELLIFWARKDERASWEKLVRALDRMDEHLASQKIKEKYMASPPPLVEEETIDLADEIDELETRYEDLSYAIQVELEEKRTEIKRFRHTLTHLPLAIRHDHYQYIEQHLSKIEEADSIECLFHHLNLYWSFLDYTLLEHIIRRHGSKDLKTKMRKYVTDITVFRKTTTLSQLSSYWCERVSLPPHFSQLTIKLDKDPTKCTVDELLIRFKTSLCDDLSLPHFTLVLVYTGEGCITTVWHIPSSLEGNLRFPPNFFARYGILRLEVNQTCLFNVQEVDFPESEYEVMTDSSIAGFTDQIDSKVAEQKVKMSRKHLQRTSSHHEWLVYIQTLTGNIIKVHCNSTDTIADIKQRLEKKEHIPIKQQQLMKTKISKTCTSVDVEAQTLSILTSTIALENDRTLIDMGIKHNDTLLLKHIPLDRSITCTVLTPERESIIVSYKVTDTVADLKLELKHMIDVPPERQQLIYGGRELEDTEQMTAVHTPGENLIKLGIIPRPHDEIVIQTLEGKRFSINYESANKPSTVKSSDTIETLKAVLYNEVGITPTQQILVCAGKRLEESQTLGGYNIKGGDIITLAISTQKPQALSECGQGKIFIKPPHGRLIAIDVSATDTVAILKARIHQIHDIPMNQQQFIFSGTELRDDQPISSYRVHEGDMLHLRFLPVLITHLPKPLSDCPNRRGQILVKTQTGGKLTLEVEASETVGDVKIKIYNLEEIPVQCQQLIFSGRQLENSVTLEEFENGSTLYLITTPQYTEPIFFVKLLHTGKLISLEYNPNYTIATVKTSIDEKEGIPSNQQDLLFAGNYLDDDKTLYDYSIQNGSTVYLIQVTEALLFVKIPALNQTLTFDHDPDATIGSIKAKICERTQIPLEDQVLVYKGNELEDKHTISYYSMSPGGTIDLTASSGKIM